MERRGQIDESLELAQGGPVREGTAIPWAPTDSTVCRQPLCHLERNPGMGGGTNTGFTETAN